MGAPAHQVFLVTAKVIKGSIRCGGCGCDYLIDKGSSDGSIKYIECSACGKVVLRLHEKTSG